MGYKFFFARVRHLSILLEITPSFLMQGKMEENGQMKLCTFYRGTPNYDNYFASVISLKKLKHATSRFIQFAGENSVISF